MSRPTIAILGASADRSKFGNQSLRTDSEVFPINPNDVREHPSGR